MVKSVGTVEVVSQESATRLISLTDLTCFTVNRSCNPMAINLFLASGEQTHETSGLRGGRRRMRRDDHLPAQQSQSRHGGLRQGTRRRAGSAGSPSGIGEKQIVKILSHQSNLICQVCNARLGISEELADTILVEPVRADTKAA
jgi:hypothetical protein